MDFEIITGRDFEDIRKKILKAKKENKTILFQNEDDELSRKVLEKLKIDILLLNQSKRRDKLKQRVSGFNQVLAKLAKKNDTIVGINLDEILEAKNLKQKSEIIARVKQNIKLSNKNKIKMKFITLNEKNKKNKYDLKALGLTLGMPTETISQF